MTNKEKFKEVFGHEMNDSSDCGFFDCSDRDTCDGCVVKNAKDYWNSEYIPPQSGTWVTMSYDAYVELLSNTVKEQEPTSFQWCTDCKEYDQEKHCCHRWSKVIRDTVEEMKQEPKEITLDEVKEYCRKRCLTLVTNQLFHELTHHQKPILDKIRAEIIHETESIWNTAIVVGMKRAVDIIDKYKAESEE